MDSSLIAAIDLGSNSFRLQIARVEDGRVYPLDSIKESVRFAAGLQADKTLSNEAKERALTALAKFSERLRGFAAVDVRAVATNTFRVAHDASEFLPIAEATLGFPIEIIAGREEARLIYLGATHTLPPFSGRRLVIDIGGGSTEFIIGRRFSPLVMESLRLGCVANTQQFFPEGKWTKAAFREAELAAACEVEVLVEEYTALGWDEVIGSSGTAKALAELLTTNQLNPDGVAGITLVGMEALKAQMIRAGCLENLRLQGLRPDRAHVLAGGLAIMLGIFNELQLSHMQYADGALRQGVLYDLLGRTDLETDLREESVLQMQRRFQVSPAQAARVQQLALALFNQLSDTESLRNQDEHRFLEWAAQLHEIGWAVAHSSYHKHGAYMLAHADLPGFSRHEQSRLAWLILGHRGKLNKLGKLEKINSLLALRLAVLFNRGRGHGEAPSQIKLAAYKNGYSLTLPAAWLNAHPLSHTNLVEEMAIWQTVGVNLSLQVE